MTFKAIEKIGKTDSDGNLYIGRRAMRDAVFAVKFDGLSGPISCDAYGQCASFKPGVYEYISADPKTFAIGVNPKLVWP
jgi:branched-chain amino acid transport system substrate-binding protein